MKKSELRQIIREEVKQLTSAMCIENVLNKLTVRLTKSAADSMERDLKANGVKFTKETPTIFVMDDSPKARIAIRLVKERFGTKAIKVEQ